MPITHTDGASYFSQAEIDGMIGERVKNHGAKLAEITTQAKTWEDKYKAAEPQLGQVQTLTTQLEEFKQKATSADGALKRYQAAASHGITDADTIWALEQAHARQMAGVEAGKQSDFPTWVTAIKADPNLAPAFLRPALAPPQATQAPTTAGNAPTSPANTATGAQGAPPQPTPVQRPAWATATTGQAPVVAGQTPSFSDRVNGAKSLDDLMKLQGERAQGRR